MIRHQSQPETYQNKVKLAAHGTIDFRSMVVNNAVIVFARSGCCLCPVVGHLLQSAGANPALYEMEEKDVNHVAHELKKVDAGAGDCEGHLHFPAVFIGGRWFGGLDRIIVAHITEELAPVLKQGGALWL